MGVQSHHGKKMLTQSRIEFSSRECYKSVYLVYFVFLVSLVYLVVNETDPENLS
jgi:hypothetical protein